MDKDGLIWNTNMKGTRRLAIPVGKVRKAMLEGIHAELGHPSAQQICDDISDCYFIPDIFRDARAMVDACPTCFSANPMQKAIGFNASYDMPPHPFYSITMDLATGLNEEGVDSKFDAVLVIQDDLTRFTIYAPSSKSATSRDIIEILQNRVMRDFGTPTVIKSDQQACFTSAEFTGFLARKGIRQQLSTVGHHQHTAERAIGTLRTKIRRGTDRDGKGWMEDLDSWQHATNRAKSQTGDKLSPFQRLLGYQPPIPLLQRPQLTMGRSELEASRALGWVRHSFTTLLDNLAESRAKVAEEFDKGRIAPKIVVGSWVAVPVDLAKTATTIFDDNTSAKARDKFVGPFKVLKAAEGDNWMVNLGGDNANGNIAKFHVSVLKLLPQAAGEVRPKPGQPEVLCWEDGSFKVRLASGKRWKQKKPYYLVHYWGQHDAMGTWVAPNQVKRSERVLLTEYDNRASKGIPSRVHERRHLDLSRKVDDAVTTAE
jgi:hypothetical protein